MRPSSGLFDEEIAATPLAECAGRRWHSAAAQSLCALCGTDDPVAAIRALARDLVAESELARPAENLPLLASLQDVVGIEACEMADAGRLVPTGRGLVIQVNRAHSEARRAFSASHEICHTLIPCFGTGAKKRLDASTGFYEVDAEEEYLCDIGASEILLPTRAFQDALGTSRPCIQTLCLLAADFGASLEATAIKLVRFGSADLGVIVWEPGWKPCQVRDMAAPSLFDTQEVPPPPQKLRVRYACCSGAMREHFFPRSKSTDDGSLIDQAYKSGTVVSGRMELITGKGARSFETESYAFGFRNGNTKEKKVLSLVSPGASPC